jgi:hypothetical protein
MSTDLHAELRTARRAHQQAEYALATLLFELKTSRRYGERGHASVEDYAFVELDLPVRQTRDLIAIAKRLGKLPALAEAFQAGRLGYTKAREVVRVATPETDAAWTQRACESTSRTLERQVAAAGFGSPPPDDPTLAPAPARVTLRFEMSAANAEVLRHALARLRLDGGFGDDVDDGQLLAEMARRIAHDLDREAAAGDDANAPPAPPPSGSGFRFTDVRPARTPTWVIRTTRTSSKRSTPRAPSATPRSSTKRRRFCV